MYKNHVELIGFLGKDAQVRTANSNDNEFTVLSIATQQSWKNEETGDRMAQRHLQQRSQQVRRRSDKRHTPLG